MKGEIIMLHISKVLICLFTACSLIIAITPIGIAARPNCSICRMQSSEIKSQYIDEDGNNSMSLIYAENDILLKFKMENDLLITEWGKLRPVISENEPPGFYFVRRSE